MFEKVGLQHSARKISLNKLLKIKPIGACKMLAIVLYLAMSSNLFYAGQSIGKYTYFQISQ